VPAPAATIPTPISTFFVVLIAAAVPAVTLAVVATLAAIAVAAVVVVTAAVVAAVVAAAAVAAAVPVAVAAVVAANVAAVAVVVAAVVVAAVVDARPQNPNNGNIFNLYFALLHYNYNLQFFFHTISSLLKTIGTSGLSGFGMVKDP
jgi:hypothetical protein